MIKKYHFDDLKCKECGMEVIEELQNVKYIQNVFIDFDCGDITIESDKELSEKEMLEIIEEIVLKEHITHKDYFSSIPNVITEEFVFEDIDCPNCAKKVERALNNNDKIIDASVNFINKKIIIKHFNNIEVYNIANKILHSIESDAKLYKEDNVQKNEKKPIMKYILFFISFIIYFTSICLDKFSNVNRTFVVYSYVVSYIFISHDIFIKSIRGFVNKDFFNENLLMVLASLGALIINEPIEGIMVILLYKIGEFFQDLATNRSKNAIKSLVEMKKDTVMLKDGSIKNIKDVKIGEVITIHVGEQVPLDGIIKNGETNIDMKSLTGESTPIFTKIGEEILSGAINLTRVIDVEVRKNDTESTIAKVLKLVNEASNNKSKSEDFITKFARIYTPIILVLAIIIGLVQGLIIKEDITKILNGVFSLLVISCPCALVISIPLGYFSGIGRCSISGILVKGGNYLEALANAKTFVFDKTGTITKSNFKVTSINAIYPHSEKEVLEIVASVEQYSMHPIAYSIKEAYKKKVNRLVGAKVEELGGLGLKVIINDNEKEKIILVGNDKLMKENNVKYIDNNEVGTILYLSINNEFYGSIVINDEIKEEAYSVIDYLNSEKYQSIMLTGDSEEVARNVSDKIGITKYYARLLPQEKYQEMKKIIDEKNKNIVYVGDGINDTPSLKLADVGIAMGGIGSDSAKECADVVIMNDDLSKICEVINISKFTKRIIIQNIVLALCIKLIAIIIGISGLLGSFAMIIALFADVGVCLIAILNVLRILKYKNK